MCIVVFSYSPEKQAFLTDCVVSGILDEKEIMKRADAQ